MSGFVGSRARKRRRNIFISFGILLLIVVIFLIFPTFENTNNKIVPNDNIIPNPSEELTSLASNIEELELNLFQKEIKRLNKMGTENKLPGREKYKIELINIIQNSKKTHGDK